MILIDSLGVAFFNGTVTIDVTFPLDQGYIPRGPGQESFGNTEALADQPEMFTTTIGPVVDETAWGSGLPIAASDQHYDYHYRLWVFPTVLQLTNPQLGVNIPFRLWNTWYDNETISSVLVNGSEVLTFDVGPGTVLTAFQFREVNMQIGPGEPSVDALVEFVTENMEGILRVLAAISDTFNLIPDVPVREIWEFKTDILENYRGQEQRIALRRYPRIRQEFDVEIIDLRQRREQYLLLRKNIVVQSLIAFYQYGVQVNGYTPIGGLKIFCETKWSNFRVDEFVAVVNTTTEELFLGKVTLIEADGVTVNSASGIEIDGINQAWVAMPSFNCLVEDGSGITMNMITGRLSIKADTYNDPPLLRPGATRTIDTFDGLPWLNRRHLTPAAEDFSFRRDVIDSEVGVRDVNSRDFHPKISGTRKFVIQRNADPDEMDYWRSLFDTVRGAQKSFLMSTYFPDLTLVPGQLPLVDGASSFTINEGDANALLLAYETWSRIEITHSNGERTQHKITSRTANLDGTVTIGFTPNIPAGVAYRNPQIISYLMRVRATDRVAWEHFANYSEVSFGFVSSDE